MLKALYDIPLCVFVGKIEQMDGTSRVRDVDGHGADLSQAVGALVETKELRYRGCRLRAEFTGRNVGGKRGGGGIVAEKRTEEVDMEKLIPHAEQYTVSHDDTLLELVRI